MAENTDTLAQENDQATEVADAKNEVLFCLFFLVINGAKLQ